VRRQPGQALPDFLASLEEAKLAMKTVGSGGGGGDAQMVRLLVSGLLLDADPGVVKVRAESVITKNE